MANRISELSAIMYAKIDSPIVLTTATLFVFVDNRIKTSVFQT